MEDLFSTQLTKTQEGLPRLRFQFREAEYRKLKSTFMGKTILFTDHGQDWTDEQIVLAYRAQHHVEADFRRLKDPRYLSFRPTFHWTDQKLRVHAFYCVLALMILNLLRRKLAQSGIVWLRSARARSPRCLFRTDVECQLSTKGNSLVKASTLVVKLGIRGNTEFSP